MKQKNFDRFFIKTFEIEKIILSEDLIAGIKAHNKDGSISKYLVYKQGITYNI